MEMLNPHCGIVRDGRSVVRLAVCNAGSLNILSSAVTDGVREGFEKLATDRSVRAVILTGESEKSMIGGADIREMARLDQKSAEAFITRLRDLCEAIRRFPAPVIARLPGWCLGGGLEVAAACDFRVAAHDAMLGMPEVRVGVPSVIQAALLPPMIGPGRAAEMLLTSAPVSAATALEWGLVNRVVPDDQVRAAAEEMATSILQAGPDAIRLQKELIVRWRESDLASAVRYGINAFATAYATGEPREGMTAYLEKRRPNFRA